MNDYMFHVQLKIGGKWQLSENWTLDRDIEGALRFYPKLPHPEAP
jgi:hypothetical protein